jgi:YgiT-type zinc finger domain-containing protein
MECVHCKGKLVRATAPFSVTRNGYHIAWDAIPAWVCSQCGEPLFEAHELELIQDALQRLDEENCRFRAPAA